MLPLWRLHSTCLAAIFVEGFPNPKTLKPFVMSPAVFLSHVRLDTLGASFLFEFPSYNVGYYLARKPHQHICTTGHNRRCFMQHRCHLQTPTTLYNRLCA